ncbi:ABC transporter substrate-binding protein [Corynebacterium caspium]|uniref:ABC transporter substrate-binding protein n=1 Tax=Corynebacterium caspium TaxID=234828 RepID=UPI000369B5BE|nr:ABC transporter substrate-binding protein [Corynebacterium caspium]WKD58731.1 corrinoid ABC transporter substrate-binding protein [Corynebacterium caspium DSM 44850]
MKVRNMRRGVIAVVAAAAMALTGCSSAKNETGAESTKEPAKTTEAMAGGAFKIVDVEGRTVEFDKAPEHIILGESRNLFATSILNKDKPLDKIVGWGTDMQRNVSDYWSRGIIEMPEIAKIPEIGAFSKGDVTVENLLTLDPDVVVLSKDERKAAEKGGIISAMEAADIKYVVTDFRSSPLQNTTKSMEILGALFGREKEAAEFNAEWQKTVDMIEERTANIADKPTTFVWRAAGIKDCCSTWNNANISELVNHAGGKNLGDEFVQGEAGDLTPEQVIDSNPQVIIATGGDWSNKKNSAGDPAAYAAAGYGIDSVSAQETMKKAIAAQPGFELLDAPKSGDFHSMWHQFYNSPFNYLAMLQIAAWLHPDKFQDIDVQQKWLDAQERWSILPGEGAFFNTMAAS